MATVADMLHHVHARSGLSLDALAELLGASRVSVARWMDGSMAPGPFHARRIHSLYASGGLSPVDSETPIATFRSRGLQRQPSLFDPPHEAFVLTQAPGPAILSRVMREGECIGASLSSARTVLDLRPQAAFTPAAPMREAASAGKNTYTYDAHTYHTKVPPQGIVELLSYYLPSGGLVLDPFAGSGMTGVAARIAGNEVILNELSPAACFIASRFISVVDPGRLGDAVNLILEDLRDLRKTLYTTRCRECGQDTEILYTVWSYRVVCYHCSETFTLWDHCRAYGRTVREHKILTEFPCPHCAQPLRKAQLPRLDAVPVLLGYKCCSRGPQETMRPLEAADFARLESIESQPALPDGYYPTTELPDGVNLRQPRKHGLMSIDRFYTRRNLLAMSYLWRNIHRVEDTELAAHLAFAFTSLYQRVTRLSEFRFWGGSGNTARFNVPYIFNEANVFITFARKARSIQDHLATTAREYKSSAAVTCGSATRLSYLPDNCVDLIFTDPPFGGNINYSEMNILWESWLGRFTDTRDEAIINRTQGKGLSEYQQLMTASLEEAHRVLRPGHWMLLMFMNSSAEVWRALRDAIQAAGFVIERIDTFDKQHGTFKQFVSENTAGLDLVLHCLKPAIDDTTRTIRAASAPTSIEAYLREMDGDLPRYTYLHVDRAPEIDFRKLYSDWLSRSLMRSSEVIDFAAFREIALTILQNGNNQSNGSDGSNRT